MRPSAFALTAALAAALLPAGATAQILPRLPLVVEVRAGVGVPTGALVEGERSLEAEPGPALSAGAALRLGRALSLYAEYNRTTLGCEQCGAAGLDDQLTDAGGGLGVRLDLGTLPLGPWLRAGGVYHELRFSSERGSLYSEPGFGVQAGAGASFPLVGGLRASPGVYFRAYSADLDLGGLPGRTVEVNQLILDLALAYRF